MLICPIERQSLSYLLEWFVEYGAVVLMDQKAEGLIQFFYNSGKI